MKTSEEILEKNTGHAYGLMGAMVIKSMEEYAAQFKTQWIPIEEMRNHNVTNNTILLFDDGSIRRFAELNHPFAESTHFYNLPELP